MHLDRATPCVPCCCLQTQVAFYTRQLGFVVGLQAENDAFLTRDAVALRLIEVSAGTDLSDPAREASFYIDVTDLDAMCADLATTLADLPAGRVRAPFDQRYGQREFHVIDEDGTLIFFGEATDG